MIVPILRLFFLVVRAMMNTPINIAARITMDALCVSFFLKNMTKYRKRADLTLLFLLAFFEYPI